jgi:GMP synthase-like glutamine amidotransferase
MQAVGIVNMYGYSAGAEFVKKAIEFLGYRPYIIDGFIDPVQTLQNIKASPIKHWIFTGSPHAVLDPDSVQIPIDILLLYQKKFLLLCYSMESFLFQLGYGLKKRYVQKKEYFYLKYKGRLNFLYRNHFWYIPKNEFLNSKKFLASTGRESMIVQYKNCLLMQFHPEKTRDGIEFIKQWLD